MSWNRIRLSKRQSILISIVASTALLFFLMLPPVWQLMNGPIVVTRWPKEGETLFTLGPKEKNHWVEIEKVSYHFINAVIVSEDARFYQHWGIDTIEIINSIKLNLKHGRYVRGASTISQQVVKMAFLNPEKTIIRKFRELIGALLLEALLEKDKILEWYLNLVEFGDGVFGVKEAAEHYYDTSPELLTIQQSANLALVIPSPNNWSSGLRKKSLTDFGHQRYRHIIEMMYQQGYITETLRKAALATGDFGRPIIEKSANPESGDKVETIPYKNQNGKELAR